MGSGQWHGALQGFIMVLVVFSLFINNLDNGTKLILSKFAEDTKWSGGIDTPPGHAAVQGDLIGLEKWANGKLVKESSTKGNSKSCPW